MAIPDSIMEAPGGNNIDIKKTNKKTLLLEYILKRVPFDGKFSENVASWTKAAKYTNENKSNTSTKIDAKYKFCGNELNFKSLPSIKPIEKVSLYLFSGKLYCDNILISRREKYFSISSFGK